jgi:superoxide dismutase, Fe-Mn family
MTHAVKPLPFDPTKLRGISERMITSHHQNNYGGAVANLNKVEVELAKLGAEAPPFVIAGLRERELTFGNSAVLHELYFENLGGPGGAPSGAIAHAISDAHGSVARWEEQFRAIGLGLGGGSGWVISSFDLHRVTLRTSWSGHHTQTAACGLPLLVMDMYEHSYQMDYGAAAAKYIDAFFANISWEVVERRLERARKFTNG